jgi:hypothetical protein
MFLMGMVMPLIPLNTLKACGQWFSRRQWGLASGVLSMGMALGFIRLYVQRYGPVALAGRLAQCCSFTAPSLPACILPWLFTRPAPGLRREKPASSKPVAMRQAVRNVLRIRNVILLGITLMGFSGCIQGALGYLPLYLRGLGWNPASADGPWLRSIPSA